MATTQPLPTEAQMLAALERGQVQLPPLRLADVQRESSRDAGVDAIARLQWNGKGYRLAIQCKATSFPKSIEEATKQAKAAAAKLRGSAIPTILVPFLSEEQLTRLEEWRVSGIDLCGNGVVMVPGELLVKRSGQPNRFAREGTIKNVYRGTSSLVARAFLLQREFKSVTDILQTVTVREGDVTLATVSKVATALEKELIIERRRNPRQRTQRLALLQPEKLLLRLSDNFVAPQITDRFSGKLRMPLDKLTKWAEKWKSATGERLLRTGADSVEGYATMAREPLRRFYCTNLAELEEELSDSLTRTDRFPDVELLQTEDETVYFDPRRNLLASPIQTYLELMAGDKRDRETADQVRRLILDSLK